MNFTRARALPAGPPALGPTLTPHRGNQGRALVGLRPLEPEDRRAWVAARGNAPVRAGSRHTHRPQPHPLATLHIRDDTWPAYLAQTRRQAAAQFMFTWAITLEKTLVGQAQLVLPQATAAGSVGRIDLWVGTEHQRRGVATTAVALLTNYASELSIGCIEALALPSSVAAVTIATRTGWSVATLAQTPMRSAWPGRIPDPAKYLLLSKELL